MTTLYQVKRKVSSIKDSLFVICSVFLIIFAEVGSIFVWVFISSADDLHLCNWHKFHSRCPLSTDEDFDTSQWAPKDACSRDVLNPNWCIPLTLFNMLSIVLCDEQTFFITRLGSKTKMTRASFSTLKISLLNIALNLPTKAKANTCMPNTLLCCYH